MIKKEEVERIQNNWSEGLLLIVSKYQNNKAYISCANAFIDELYSYNFCDVLFKPTLVIDTQFRNTKESALSYFIGNNDNFSEDSGFALKPWTKIRWENSGIQLFENIATAMGNYYFTKDDVELKVEFSFVFKKDDNGILRIILHDSHLPYKK
ncbi:MAG: hypothetical protein ACKVH2_05320 [Flavobacteriales bacterium]|jgi:hypothetical protein